MDDAIDKLAWIYVKDKRLLGARSKNKNIYYLPGGKREAGESDEQALRREIKEELSVKLNPATIQYAGTFSAQAHGKTTGKMVTMSCYFAEFTGKIQPEAEIEEVIWLQYADKQQCSAVTQIVMDWLKSQGLIN